MISLKTLGPRFVIAFSLPVFVTATLAQKQAAPQNQSPPQNQAPTQAQAPQGGQQSLTPDQLDELLAPIALYPDALLAQVLMASKDPQEVLDAGNWLGMQQDIGKDAQKLDDASKAAGFTQAASALMHFPDVLDMMCQELDWTKQLGQAVNADEKSVLDSVQRLRAQAVDVGSLKSNDKQKVETKKEGDQTVVVVQPANPQVIYVPQYDPQQAYAAPAQGPSTGAAVATKLLSFGVGMAVGGAIWGHDDYCYPAWGRGMYYRGARYRPPPYRPVYGGGWNRAAAYNRPARYGNNTLVVRNNNYYNRFNANANLRSGYRANTIVRPTNPNGLVASRPEYRSGANINRDNINRDKINTGNVNRGANAANKPNAQSREQANAAVDRAKKNRAGGGAGGTTPPTPGANREANREAAKNLPQSDRPSGQRGGMTKAAESGSSGGDRGQAAQARQAQRDSNATAFGGGGDSGRAAKADANRGRSSMSGGGSRSK
jgi:Protein of unknown function (DUF3300)